MNSQASPPSRSTLALGAFALFFLSFLMSGNANALPQLFFQQNYPSQKTLLLSAALFVSTMVAVVAVQISRRVRLSRRFITIAMILTAVLLEAQLWAGTAISFVLCLMAVQCLDNFLLNQIDHAAVARSGSLRSFNDAAGNGSRLFGMLAAPAFFTLLANYRGIEGAVVAVLGSIATVGAIRVFMLRPISENEKERPLLVSSPDRVDWLMFAYAITIYIALYLFATNLIYILRDLFLIPGSTARGGLAVVTVFAAALVCNGLAAYMKRSSVEVAGRTIRLAALASPAVLLIIASGLIVIGVRTGYFPFLIGGSLIGGAYGVFLLEIRDYSSRAAKQGKSVLLTWFNNMANISSLIAFGLMLGLASGRSRSPAAYYTLLMWAIALVPAAGLAVLIAAAALAKKTSESSEEVFKPA